MKCGVGHIRQFIVVRDRGTSLEMSDGIESDKRVIVNRPSTSAKGKTSSSSRWPRPTLEDTLRGDRPTAISTPGRTW